MDSLYPLITSTHYIQQTLKTQLILSFWRYLVPQSFVSRTSWVDSIVRDTFWYRDDRERHFFLAPIVWFEQSVPTKSECSITRHPQILMDLQSHYVLKIYAFFASFSSIYVLIFFFDAILRQILHCLIACAHRDRYRRRKSVSVTLIPNPPERALTSWWKKSFDWNLYRVVDGISNGNRRLSLRQRPRTTDARSDL